MLAAAPRFLLTSFRPWRAHQISNASDDLLAALQHQALLPKNTYLLRRLPVSFQLAPAEVLENIVLLRPDFVICCGLAENRCRLSLELQGVEAESFLQTPLYLPSLLSGTTITEISADAGSYVCNYLYFRVLQFLSQKPGCQALFVHVPPLNQANTPLIVQDFRRVLHQLAVLSSELLLSNS
ncbi:MAG: peptidase C15 [Leptolyngbyaceae cyanobacterium RM2_2_21]|nr:peptidase C15 [Leptolyngbyaceae cyanobacterium RM2_2_21]